MVISEDLSACITGAIGDSFSMGKSDAAGRVGVDWKGNGKYFCNEHMKKKVKITNIICICLFIYKWDNKNVYIHATCNQKKHTCDEIQSDVISVFKILVAA